MPVRFVIYLVIAVLFLPTDFLAGLAHHGQRRAPKGLVLTAKKWKDEERTLPGSMLYAADVLNDSNNTQMLQAKQMIGEYDENIEYFRCGLEGWSLRQHKWVSLWPRKLGPPPKLVNVELRPGDHKEVCRLMLPAQAGADGQCVRFKLRTRWEQSSSTVLVSNPIVIGDRRGAENTPCYSGH